jgi:hypothetical protein
MSECPYCYVQPGQRHDTDCIGKMSIHELRDSLDAAQIIKLSLTKQLSTLTAENEKLKTALKEIANTDYRGNRSQESVIAFKALKELGHE